MNKLMGFVFATWLSLGAAGSAWAAGEAPKRVERVATQRVVVVEQPTAITEFVVTGKRPARAGQRATPPAMPIEIPRLEFAIPAPVVRL